MKSNFSHILVATLLVGTLLALSDPFMYFMPMGSTLITLTIATLLVVVWSGLMFYERAEDERELVLRMHAGRVGYLAGILVLIIAVVVEGLRDTVDPWVSLALGTMIVAKLFTRLYLERRG